MKLNKNLASINIDGKYYQLKKGENIIGGLKFSIELENKSENLYSWVVNLQNESDEKSPRIKELFGLDTTINVKGETHFNTLRGDDCSIHSFYPESFVLEKDTHVERTPVGARSSNTTAFPYFDIKDESEFGLVCGIGWSGQWKLDVYRNGDDVRITAGFCDCDFILNPREKVRSVRILIYFGKGSTDEIRQRFVRLHREYYSPIPDVDKGFFPIAGQCFDRYYWGNAPKGDEVLYLESEDAQYKIIDAEIKCKQFNAFWIDAFWFDGAFRTGVGNYKYAKGFPNGLKQIGEYVHKNNMKFVLWFEPVRCNKNTEIANRFGYDKTKIISLPNAERMVVNLGDEEVWQYQFENISKVIEENGVDIYRQDFNIDPYDYLVSIEDDDRKGLVQIRFVEGMYRLWDALKERFPNIIIDNCASGGRLLDVETLSRSIPLWRSDMACRPSPASMQNEILGLSRYIPYHQGGAFDYTPYFVRSSMTTGIACELPFLEGNIDPSKEETSLKAVSEPRFLISELKNKTIDTSRVQKQFDELLRIKEYWKGDFTPLTPPSDKFDAIIAYSLKMPNEDNGVVLVFRREEAPKDYTIKLKNICEDKKYSLILSDESLIESAKIISGKELKEGFKVIIDQAPASLLIYYSAIE